MVYEKSLNILFNYINNVSIKCNFKYILCISSVLTLIQITFKLEH